mmetsp:Transcript_24823/g.73700  ORF Transcript_24823/g.73700 Transcript_24823/m.73700 type:complete len:245 (-) Transcript_24823:657-1391(-)
MARRTRSLATRQRRCCRSSRECFRSGGPRSECTRAPSRSTAPRPQRCSRRRLQSGTRAARGRRWRCGSRGWRCPPSARRRCCRKSPAASQPRGSRMRRASPLPGATTRRPQRCSSSPAGPTWLDRSSSWRAGLGRRPRATWPSGIWAPSRSSLASRRRPSASSPARAPTSPPRCRCCRACSPSALRPSRQLATTTAAGSTGCSPRRSTERASARRSTPPPPSWACRSRSRGSSPSTRTTAGSST